MSNFFKRWSNLKAENIANKSPELIESQKSLVTDKVSLDNSLPILNAENQITNEGLLKEPGPEDVAQNSTQGPSLDDVGKLTPESDFTTFMNKDVAGDVHQAAMKKLFSDPHFNVMDGLDIYIDEILPQINAIHTLQKITKENFNDYLKYSNRSRESFLKIFDHSTQSWIDYSAFNNGEKLLDLLDNLFEEEIKQNHVFGEFVSIAENGIFYYTD